MAGKTVPTKEAEERWAAVRNADGNVSEAARNLGMQRQRLSNWLHRNPQPGAVVANENGETPKARARRSRKLPSVEQIRAEAVRVEDLTPVEIFRKFFESYDLLQRELRMETERVVNLEADVRALKDENIRLRGQVSFYEDQDKRKLEEWRAEMRKRISDLNQPGD